MNKSYRWALLSVASIFTVVAALLFCFPVHAAYDFPPLMGKHAVGTQLFYFTRFEATKSLDRELPVQIWYPTDGRPGVPTSPYAYEALEMFKRGFRRHYKKCTEEHIAAFDDIRTHAIFDAPILGGHAPYPVIIFSHGYGMNRGEYSLLCEEIASHGYLVMMVVHAGVTELMRFSGGKEVELDDETMLDRNTATLGICFVDIQSMLDQLISSGFEAIAGKCNLNKIGIIGHSLGGIMAAQMCSHDERIKAGISLDGPLFGIDTTKPFHKPFMLMRAPGFYEMFSDDESILQQMNNTTKQEWIEGHRQFFKVNSGSILEVIIEGAEHNTFTDRIVLTSIFQKIFNDETIDLDAGKVSVAAEIEIRERITSFLDQHVRLAQ